MKFTLMFQLPDYAVSKAQRAADEINEHISNMEDPDPFYCTGCSSGLLTFEGECDPSALNEVSQAATEWIMITTDEVPL